MRRLVLFGLILLAGKAFAIEIHVSQKGNDANAGMAASPFRTINKAAQVAQAGDQVIVHEGIYRERVDPARGGESAAKRIVYKAAKGEKVIIKGSEVIKGWKRRLGDTWQVDLPNTFFGNFNPYNDVLHGDWFEKNDWIQHSGAVYLNGNILYEAKNQDEVLAAIEKNPSWFGSVGKDSTVIIAQFKDVNPNEELVEINVRQSVFYPKKTRINYLTVRGFILEQAATPWAPPTAEQIGAIGTHWSKGWIIENNIVRYSKCAGITLGKYGDEWDNRSESAEGYVKTIERSIQNGWNKETVGSHIVRNNEVYYCEQAGICGSMGAAYSVITNNSIHDIRVLEQFWGYEVAGIKLHGAVDVEISRNHIYRTEGGIWLDWMLQGTRITRNLLHDNRVQDISFEVDHGPVLVDNNMFLSGQQAQLRVSQGCAFVHNLFAYSFWDVTPPDSRQTPYLKPHSTEIAGLHDNPCGDTRYYNNILIKPVDLSVYNIATLPVAIDGNVYLGGAKPSKFDKSVIVDSLFNPKIKVIEEKDGFYFEMEMSNSWNEKVARKFVTTELLGKAIIPDQKFETFDGSPIAIDRDYFGKKRNTRNPAPGPFEKIKSGKVRIKVW
jgi:hypothetical protein